jgi:hypothetical protein
LHPELLAPFPKFFHLEKGARSSGWLQLKYSSGVIPGKPLKRKSTEEEILARKRKYELSRERIFLSVWQSGRPWLKYLEDSKVMVCLWTWCTVSPSVPKLRDISFVKGSDNLNFFKSINKMMDINNGKC